VEGAAAGHHESAAALLPQAAPVFDEAPALDTPVDMLTPPPPVGKHLMGAFLLPWQLLAAGLLGRHADRPLGQCDRQEAQLLQQPAPPGKGYGVASARRFSGTRPPYVALRKRIVSRALTSRTFVTVWSFFLPFYQSVCTGGSWGRPMRRAVPSWAKGSVTKRLLCIPVQSPSERQIRGEEQWHCPPRGEVDAQTHHPCHAKMSSRAPWKPCLRATFLFRFLCHTTRQGMCGSR
jgi:hypothetical protein